MKKIFSLIIGLTLFAAISSQAVVITHTVTTNEGLVFSNSCLLRSITILNPNGTNNAAWVKFYDSYTNSPWYAYTAFTNSTISVINTNMTNIGLMELGATGLARSGDIYTNAMGVSNWFSFPSGQAYLITTNSIKGATNSFNMFTVQNLLSNVPITTVTFPSPLYLIHGLYYTNNVAGTIGNDQIQFLFDVSFPRR